MTYDEAFKMEPGDEVTIIATGERRHIDIIEGHRTSLFFIMEDGQTYSHKCVTK